MRVPSFVLLSLSVIVLFYDVYLRIALAHCATAKALGATDPLKIHSDFWVMFMWKRLMGTDVYDVNSTAVTKDPDVRVYGHCGVPPSPHAYIVDRAAKASHEAAAIEINAFMPEAVSSPATQMGLLLININTTSSRKVMLSNGGDTGGSTFTSWTLTAGADGVFGEAPLLNGKPLPVRSVTRPSDRFICLPWHALHISLLLRSFAFVCCFLPPPLFDILLLCAIQISTCF